MRSFIPLILLLFISSIIAQENDQVLVLQRNMPQPFLMLDIRSAIVISDELPLRIKTPVDLNPENIIRISRMFPDSPDPVLLEVIHPSMIESFPNMFDLILGSTNMRRIGQNSFRTCSQLLTVSLDHNYIQEVPIGVFRNCSNVRSLGLNGNQITSLHADSFLGLTSLMDITLHQNRLTSITADIFTHIQQINFLMINSNPITELIPGIFPLQLEAIWFNDCEITELHPETFHNLTQLVGLYLDGNPIEILPPGVFSHQTSLRGFSLARTNVRRLNINSFGVHPSLTDFSIHNSAFDELQPGFFNNFPNLRVFDTRNNTCANIRIEDIRVIDFEADPVLHQCFANWFWRDTTTSTTTEAPPQGDSGNILTSYGLSLFILMVINLYLIN